jgi:hypothetical protein
LGGDGIWGFSRSCLLSNLSLQTCRPRRYFITGHRRILSSNFCPLCRLQVNGRVASETFTTRICSAVRSRHCPSVTPRRFETTSQIVIGGTGGHSITLQGSPVTGFERLQKRLGLIGKVFPKSSKSSEKFTFIAAASSTRFKPHFLEETRASGSASAMPFFTVSCRAATCLSNECEGQLFKM